MGNAASPPAKLARTSNQIDASCTAGVGKQSEAPAPHCTSAALQQHRDVIHAPADKPTDVASDGTPSQSLCSGRRSDCSSPYHDAHSSTPPSRIVSPAPNAGPMRATTPTFASYQADSAHAVASCEATAAFEGRGAETTAHGAEGAGAAFANDDAPRQQDAASCLAASHEAIPDMGADAHDLNGSLSTPTRPYVDPAVAPGSAAQDVISASSGDGTSRKFGWLFDDADGQTQAPACFGTPATAVTPGTVPSVALSDADLSRIAQISAAAVHALDPTQAVTPLGATYTAVLRAVATGGSVTGSISAYAHMDMLRMRSVAAGAPVASSTRAHAHMSMLRMLRTAARDPGLARAFLGNERNSAYLAAKRESSRIMATCTASDHTQNEQRAASDLAAKPTKQTSVPFSAAGDSPVTPRASSGPRAAAGRAMFDFSAGASSFKFTASAPPVLPGKQLKAVRTVPKPSEPLFVYGTRNKAPRPAGPERYHEHSSSENLPLVFADENQVMKALAHVQLGAALPGMLLFNSTASDSVLSFTKRGAVAGSPQTRAAAAPQQDHSSGDAGWSTPPAQPTVRTAATANTALTGSGATGQIRAASAATRTHAEAALAPVPAAAAPVAPPAAPPAAGALQAVSTARTQALDTIEEEGELQIQLSKPTLMRSAVMAGGRRMVSKRHGAGKTATSQFRRAA